MKTYSEFAAENEGRIFWRSDAGIIGGQRCLYATLEYYEGNKLCVIRETVIDDRI